MRLAVRTDPADPARLRIVAAVATGFDRRDGTRMGTR
jgi:hypothetical protein